MRDSMVCPKCGGRVFYAIDKAQMQDPQYRNAVVALTAAAEYLATGVVTFFGRKHEIMRSPLSAFVCGSCGYTEWYTSTEALKEMVAAGADTVRRVDASTTKDRYR